MPDLDEIERAKGEFVEAVEEEQEAASKAAAAEDRLRELGVSDHEIARLDPRP